MRAPDVAISVRVNPSNISVSTGVRQPGNLAQPETMCGRIRRLLPVNHIEADDRRLSDSRTDRARILLPGQPLDAILTLIIRFRDADWFGLAQRPAVRAVGRKAAP